MQKHCAPNRSYHVVALLLLMALCASASTNDLIAHFTFDGTPNDASGHCPPFDLRNTEFVDGSLYCNGCYEYSGTKHGYRANGLVPQLNYDGLTFSLDFYAIDFNPEHERDIVRNIIRLITGNRAPASIFRAYTSHDTIIVVGEAYRWLSLRTGTNGLELTLNNQAFVHGFTNALVQPNRWHNIICSFDLRAKKVLVALDGRVLDTVALPPSFNLLIGKRPQQGDKDFCFDNYSNGSAFYGFASNLKVFGHAFSPAELLALYASDAPARAKLHASSSPDNSWWLYAIIPTSLVVGATAWIYWRRKRARLETSAAADRIAAGQ